MKAPVRFIVQLQIMVASLVVLFIAGHFSVAYAVDEDAITPSDPVTIITVDSGTDPDNSKSRTCANETPCTLRRAIVQARGLSAGQRPILIQFDIPDEEDEGYDDSLGVWEIEVMSTFDPSVFRAIEGGEITIDGATQPDGRAGGPKIILIGPGTGNRDGIIVGTNNAGGHDGNVVQGLGFQNFKTHLIVNSNDNIIENNWFGLSSDGLDVYLRDDEPEDGSGSAGVALSANVEDNIVQSNVFLGFDGVAAAMRGEGNSFKSNYVGTIANGTVPNKQTDPKLICTTVDWLGGGGISLEGNEHQIETNVFAGLRQEIFQISTQAAAVRASGDEHTISNNRIGIDTGDNEVGVCGRGIYLIGGPEKVMVSDNQITDSALSAISLNGALYDANTLRSNIIKRTAAWPQVEGNPTAENAIQLGPSLPDAMLTFNPAKVTQINGKSVSGTQGTSSPCPNCTVELFLDDMDSIKEALQSLAVVTADSNGNWSATIPENLTSSQSIRTTSTTAQFNTIANMSAGTTTGLSRLYFKAIKVFLPRIQ